jgi:hypothetical protein
MDLEVDVVGRSDYEIRVGDDKGFRCSQEQAEFGKKVIFVLDETQS